jgi:predicted GIY-YIG superfamily endonuclease
MAETGVIGTTYLLHFSRPFHHARHYTGWTQYLAYRLRLHRTGQSGVRLIRAAVDDGVRLRLAQTWPDTTRAWERELKNRHNAARYCPICIRQAERARAREQARKARAAATAARRAERAATRASKRLAA